MELWKVPQIAKGLMSFVGPLYRWHLLRGGTQGTDSPEYCVSIWHRSLLMLQKAGFDPCGCRMVELGPGDSIGVGLVALLSGMGHYTGLDVAPFARSSDLVPLFDRIVEAASRDPETARNIAVSRQEIERLRGDLARGFEGSDVVRYQVPWFRDSIDEDSVDLVFSQSVMQAVDRLEEAFEATYRWLRPGGFAYHSIPFSAQWLSPYWNGHWAYSDLEWRLVRGRRLFLMNRAPISTYVETAESVGFEVLLVRPRIETGGLPQSRLASRFRNLDHSDGTTRGADIVLRKSAEAGDA